MAEIKLYGTLVTMTTDQKAAYARQLYDEAINKFQNIINSEIYDKLSASETDISDIYDTLSTLVIDNLTSDDNTKALSAKQGKILKSLIDAIHSFSIVVLNENEELPAVGESNTLYLKKKPGSSDDIYNEYIYLSSGWELVGNTDIDLSNYYTKSEVDAIKTQLENSIPTIPNIEVVATGTGNVITSIDVDNTNKHKLNVSKGIDVYSKSEIDDALSNSGFGDVIAEATFTTADRVITSSGANKVIKDSGILIGNLALKSSLGTLASKDKVDQSDLNFSIPEGTVIDSTLSTTSENPVQNKVITTQLNNKVNNATLSSYVKTADLNTRLGNYYLKTETYSRSEVDNKIASAGGGDVMADGEFTVDNIIIAAGTKSIKNSGVLLSSLATQTWVSSQNYLTISSLPVASNTVAGIVSTGDQDFAGEKTFITKVNAQTADVVDLIVTSLEFYGLGYFSYVASTTDPGGIKIGATTSGSDLPLVLNNESQAYITLTSAAVISALGYTPAQTSDIPEIPIALPNPYSLSITANGVNRIYNGNAAISINLDDFYSKKLIYSTSTANAGYGGYITLLNQSYFLTGNEVYSEDKPDSVIVVPYNYSVTTTGNTKVKKSEGFDSVTATSGYKCYCFTRITDDLILANVQIYN